jgi:hypothetical protein
MHESAIVAHGADEGNASTIGRDKGLYCFFFDSVGQGRDMNLRPGFEIITAIDGYAGATKPMIAIKGVDLEGFDHPSEDLGIACLALVVYPRCEVCLESLS